jgi:tetratricopeptide (TPR) repeat protein
MKYSHALAILLFVSPALAVEETKGLLSEIRLNDNEDQNQNKSFTSEVMITKAENKAIESLKNIIKKKTGTREEADLLYRLAELYMRRAKSGRFFDLDKSSENKLKSLGLHAEKARDGLKQAIQIYNQIQSKFPHYHDLDYVFFNSALAHSQLKETEVAKKNYLQLISQFSTSELVPDALLEVGELFYQQQNFHAALEKFKDIEKYPESRAFPYGLYKSAWCYYNLKNTEAGINQLLLVVKQNPPDAGDSRKYNLRKEALRDLTLFTGETLPAADLLGFFKKICTEDELGDVIAGMTDLYESHSRYKEISVFVDEFIDRYPHHKQTPKLFSKLVETLETLKLRDKVIKKLADMGSFCKDEKNPDCKTEFKRVSLDISKKWWDIWLKNKSNTEFSVLTEKAFENLLSQDNPESPDFTSRFAFAELLFQQNKFDRAAEQYEQVSLQKQPTAAIKHDSLYGSLFSVEKQLEKKENSDLTEKQKQLALRYINEFPKGEHFEEVVFKLGFIAYSQTQHDLALSYFNSLFKSVKDEVLREKAEDLVLDIYNIKKDYVTIRKLADSFTEKTKKADRKLNLAKISEEAHYADVQKNAKELASDKQIDLLLSFSNEHQKTKLGQDSYWQSISVAYANKLDVRGAELSLNYVNQYPSDKRNVDALKESVKAFIDAGHLSSAVKTLQVLAEKDPANAEKNTQLMCDLWQIQASNTDARRCYQNLLKITSKENKPAVMGKLLKTFTDTNSSEYQELQRNILAADIEPYATQILIRQAKAILEKGDAKQAFSMSLKINARPVSEDQRAEARMIQARILENEFVSQSVKSREDKMAMVLAMKTEKLDKSFTAYSSAIKMAKDEKIQAEGLRGIVRLYTHFIDSIGHMPMPATLAQADQDALKNELAKVVQPFSEKLKSTIAKLNELGETAVSSSVREPASTAMNWNSLRPESVYEPSVQYPAANKLSTLFLADSEINSLIKEKKLKKAEEKALQLTRTQEKRPQGLYYLSVIAEAEQNTDKSLWYVNKALDNKTDFAEAQYQKAKVLYSVEGFNSAFKYFEKALNTLENQTESRLMVALKAFSDRDFKKANEEFSRFSNDQLYNYGVDLIFAESKLQTGDAENALKVVESSFQKNPERVEPDLVFAKIYEGYLFNKEKTGFYYKRALGKAKTADQQNWLNKKLEFLKLNKNNQITSYVGGE